MPVFSATKGIAADQFGQIPRIETAIMNVTFFRCYRAVEQRDGSVIYEYAPIKKTTTVWERFVGRRRRLRDRAAGRCRV